MHTPTAYRGTSSIRNRCPLGPYRSLCLGPYGGPRGSAVSYQRGTAVHVLPDIVSPQPLLQTESREAGSLTMYRGTSLIRNRHPLGPYMYSTTMPRLLRS